jgi:hypothetical protein
MTKGGGGMQRALCSLYSAGMKAAPVPLMGLAMPLACVEDELHPRQDATENLIFSNFLLFVPESEQVPGLRWGS